MRCPSCFKPHPAPDGHTPLRVLAAPLQALAGHQRFYNLLDRTGFAYVEEVIATPDRCLLDLRNGGPKLIAAVRKVIADLHLEGTTAADDAGDWDLAARVTQPAPFQEVVGALQAMAAWAQAEPGARILGEILTLADGITGPPPDILRAWELVTGTRLPSLADPPDEEDLPYLAEDLLQQVDQRRRLILTTRTFVPDRRTCDSLAVQLGVGRERVRQLETSALNQLARAAAHDRYRPLRWRAPSAAQPGRPRATVIPGAPPWLGKMLSWLAGKLA